MKKITNRLISQSVFLLLIFSLLIAVLFGFLFTKHTEELHQEELIRRSELISMSMKDYFENPQESKSQHRGQNGGMGGYGAFLRFLNQADGEDVWVLDEKMQSVIQYHHQRDEAPQNLTEEIKKMVAKTYQNEQMNIEKKRNFLQIGEISVATPIIIEGTIYGVIAIHSNVRIIHKNQLAGYVMLLVSLSIAVIAASFLAWRQAQHFVKPITQMKKYIDDLANENYQHPLKIDTQDELGELGDQLSLLCDRLTQAQEAREKKQQNEQDFLSQISHELRTPIMAMKSSLEAMDEGYVDGREKMTYTKQLLQEITGLERLVNDLLELSRLESTEFQIEKRPLDILDCINDALRSQRIPLRKKRQQVQVENELAKRQLIFGDYLRLTQTFKILLDNANKYSPEGAVIHLILRTDGQKIKLTMSNPQEQIMTDHQTIFQLFQRGKQTDITGSGLGLAIAKQVIVRHHGMITAHSEDGVFFIEILLPVG